MAYEEGQMRLAAAFLAILATICPVLAQDARRVMPPAEYDQPFAGPLKVTRVQSIEAVRMACKSPLSLGLGCAYRHETGC